MANTVDFHEINKEVGSCYMNEARDFLRRSKLLYEFSLIGQMSRRAKLFIEICLCYETVLKALVFFSSEEDEQTTYKKAKTHSIPKLLGYLPKEIQDSCKHLIDINVIEFKIDSRYLISASLAFREHGIVSKKYYNTIANPVYVQSLITNAAKLISFAAKYEPDIRGCVLSEIDIEKEEEKNNRINEMLSK